MAERKSLLIVGAGAAGLGAALAAAADGIDFILLEAAARAGGVIETVGAGGGLYERAAQSTLIRDAAAWALLEKAAGDDLVEPDPRRAARLIRLPDDRLKRLGPFAFFNGLFTPLDLWALLREPRRATGVAPDSLADYARQRLGEKIYARAVFPFASGIYAGDPEAISWRHAFPRLHARAGEGSLLKSFFRPVEGVPFRARMVSGRRGMGPLMERLAGALPGGALRLAHAVETVERSGGEFRVGARGPEGLREFAAPRLIWATDAAAAAARLAPLSPALARLARIPHAPLALVHLRLSANALRLRGALGFLNAEGAGRGDLGALFPSHMFAGRAPAGEAAVCFFYGGARQPEWADPRAHDDEALVNAALVTLEKTGLARAGATPSFTAVVRHPRAIPQYALDHESVLTALAQAERALPGLKFAGNYLRGAGAGDALAGGIAAVRGGLETGG